jgi:hypothetical protein
MSRPAGTLSVTLNSEVNFGEVGFPQLKTKEKASLVSGHGLSRAGTG